MSTSYDFTSLDGQLKQRYANKITRAVPNNRFLQKNVPFVQSATVGDKFNAPVLLTSDAGFSYTDPNGGLVTLNDAVAAVMKNAELSGAEMIERAGMTYSQLARSVAPGAAFENTFDVVMKGMIDAASKRVEVAMLHGGAGLGVAASSTNVNTTKTTITMTAASWAAAIWSGAEGSKFNFYNSTSLVSSGADAVFTVSAVDAANRKVTVTGTTGGISALDSAISSNPNVITAFYQGAYGLEMAGLSKICQNTSTLFGIDAASYSLWRGNDVTTSGSLTQSKILEAVAQCANYGLSEDMVVFVNPTTFNILSSDQSSLVRHGGNDKTAYNGFSGLTFNAPSGMVTVVPHLFCKQGEVLGVNVKDIARIGASDITFQTPGKGSNYQMMFDLPEKNGVELRLYTHQAIMLYRPAQAFRLTGFTV